MFYDIRWKLLDLNFPDELPKEGDKIYTAVVSGPKMKAETTVFEKVTALECPGIEKLEVLCDICRLKYGEDSIVIWQPVPPPPKLPKKWKLSTPTRCDNERCEHYDNGYCLGGDPLCKTGYEHPEFSNWE